tara:strand:+ start:278 stop:517 length:240 start_codon:yes stop_codon:yes gene_type:complete
MFFPLAEWTESGGEKTFVHTPTQFFQGMAFGLLVAAIVPTIVAKGLIIALEDDKNLRDALSVAPNIKFMKYEVSFELVE